MKELAERSLKDRHPKKAEVPGLTPEEEDALQHRTGAVAGEVLSSSDSPLNPNRLSPGSIAHLQRVIGNQAVQRLLADAAIAPSRGATIQRNGGGSPAPATTTTKPTVNPKDAIKKAAQSLAVTGGTGTKSDVDAVVAEMIKIPLPALTALKKKGIKVVVCHQSVTEVRKDLKGVRPRGWPKGKTWDSVPGLYDSGNKRVIIATRKGRVPPKGDGHGAYNLVLHEVGHAIGFSISGAGGQSDPKFIAARNKDKKRLGTYESQAGKAGVQETYAESFARFYGKDPNDAKKYPNLHAYWASNPFVAKGP